MITIRFSKKQMGFSFVTDHFYETMILFGFVEILIFKNQV
jgi:hypothetical protein